MKNYVPIVCAFIAILSILLLNGCRQSEQAQTGDHDTSIILANQLLDHYTKQEYNDLHNKLSDPATAERASIWYPKAEKINSLTDDAFSSLDSCLKKADATPEQLTKIMAGTADKYVTSVLQIDPGLAKTFDNSFSSIIHSINFRHLSNAKATQSYVNQIHQSISIISNKAIAFCNQKTSSCNLLVYHIPSMLINQNAIHFKPGDELEITAGMGSYSSAAAPKIVIDTQAIPIGDFGYAAFKKVVTGEVGKHSVPVTVSYVSQDGTQRTTKQMIDYFIDQ